MKITFANMGNYAPAFKTLFENLGAEVILPEKTNPKAIEEGAKLSPELFCLPLKVNVGNYLSAITKGADTILMWENIGGSCRFRYYWLVQRKILRELGFNIRIWNLNSRNFFSVFKKIAKENQVPFWKILSALHFFLKEVSFIERLEKKANYFRPREIEKGQTEKVIFHLFEKLEKIKNPAPPFLKKGRGKKELSYLEKETQNLFSEIKVDSNRQVLKVGLIGEIYTLCDGAVNFQLEKKLGEMGVEVERKLNLTKFLKGALPFQAQRLQRKTASYLCSPVGGHGQEAVAEALDFAKEGFDGVIQLLPAFCMPEISVRPILQKISQEKKIPFLSISLDEQTAEAGIQTRLEAFVDLLWSCRKKINHLTI